MRVPSIIGFDFNAGSSPSYKSYTGQPVALAVAVEVVQEVVVVGLLLELLARLTQAAVEVGAVAALVLHPVVVEPKEWEVVVELV
jgi:hypothetical protein